MAFIQLDTAFLVSSALVGILYGFSVLMFIGTIWTFTYKRRTRSVNHPMAAVATLLFLLSTADMVLVITEVEDGLVKYRDTFPGGPEAFFEDFLQGTFIAKNVIYTLQTLLGDGVVIYRCYVLWQSVWVIILPCMLWCGIAAFGICWVYVPRSGSLPGLFNETIFASELGIWITAFFAFTLTSYLFSSGLVVYHIWAIERKVSAVRVTKRKMPILRVLVDATILYSAALCPFIIIFYAHSYAVFFVMGDMLVQIISIVFYMVFIRIAISKHAQDGEISAEQRTTLQFRIQSSQNRSEQNDMPSWPTAQK